jgi:excisionase family DNA binding protein
MSAGMSSFDGVIGTGENGDAASFEHASRGAAYVDLLTVPEAAAMLCVSDVTVHDWIDSGGIPYVQLGEYERIPLQGLIASLEGRYDLRGPLQEQNARMRAAGLSED